MTSSSDEDVNDAALFQEPDGYFHPEKPATHTEYTLLSGQTLRLRLVGHNPLWGHLLWNAGQVISEYLQRHAEELVVGKDVLELGAGAGLPSLVCGILGARKVVVTDYPDADLIENLTLNIATCAPLFPGPETSSIVSATGYLWGASPTPLLSQLFPPPTATPAPGFDLLILADVLFNHSEHRPLLSTLKATLRRTAAPRALVFFTPYRPWLLEKDLRFLELCREAGLVVSEVGEWVRDKVMFEEDRGDELLRRTVFGYEISWGGGRVMSLVV